MGCCWGRKQWLRKHASYWKHYRAQTHEADIQIIPRSSRTHRPFLLEKVAVFTTSQIQIHHSSKKEAKNKQINTKTIQLSCLLAAKLNQCKHPKWTALFVGESGDFRRTDNCDILYIWQMPHLMQYLFIIKPQNILNIRNLEWNGNTINNVQLDVNFSAH